MSQRERWTRVLSMLLMILALWALLDGAVWGGTPTPNEVEQVAKTLYCPLCVGQRLDTCEIPLCQEMKREIAKQLAQGRTPDEIRAYFVQQYGPVVLGEPPRRGIHWAVWVIPIIVLLATTAYVLSRIRQWTRPATAKAMVEPLPSPNAPQDEYEARVEAELAEWE